MAGRGRYPWRLGATSWVVPADLLTNVRLLAGRVDDIQLLFFESGARASLPHEVPVAELAALAAAHDLTYTVHLPADLRLGAGEPLLREEGVQEILRLVAALAPLPVQCFDLHLNREEGLEVGEWLQHLDRSLARLAGELQEKVRLLAVENTDYPFEIVWPLCQTHGLGVCLDIGHLLRHGHDWREALATYLPAARHLHYHGVEGGRDHRAIGPAQRAATTALAEALARTGYQGVLTIEVYAEERLAASLAELEAAWRQMKLKAED